HELTVEAFMKRDRKRLLRALCTDPLVPSLATAQAVLDDLYAAEKEALESWIGEDAGEGSDIRHAGPVVDSVHQGQTPEGH
ncbi:MAG: hypothetical protein R6V45_03665, partial [Oceanipulchritudo sp.]